MEKLQSAIAQARILRGENPDKSSVKRHKSGSSNVDQAWEELHSQEPSMARLLSQRIVTMEQNHEAASFDKLRTRMLQQMQANDWKRVAVTSPGPSSGKSTIVLNLAFSLARQARSRVIVSELDMRKPSMKKMLGLETSRDYVEVIKGNAAFEDHAMRLRPNFALGMLNSTSAAPAELLQDQRFGKTLDDVEAKYDPTIMMFDMPPFQVSDDMMAFADKVDCVMIVAAAEKTRMADLEVCEREISNVTNVLGVVLNKCRYEAPGSSYEYYGS